ncbi:Holliday junction resolvase RuvX [Fervidibacter sacchari]|uniref:Putative pre-16S rRNA nuclease n=1 Tax=Candidatus Fervidibacter sacchari TaxID=1448929 RepID=A0ABT2ES09_9BACT|nr:Holliday junction resolvase RuvX [Candidatus Fervidibacter sacchari]MCS3919690.1 putative Holliday junction resolvase [Candidatus Fervidibacter sacchari]WKU15406.1 Holliday junction resolvase RuvX [Candidatus Fervidibacter sacchari]
MARILAVDYGEKRIGLAVSDELGITASPLTTLMHRSDEETVRHIAQLASKLKVAQIVIGLPRRTDAQEGEMERRVKAFAEKLRQAVSVPIVLFDERFTTRIAEQVLLEADLSRRKRKQVRDRLAAVILLQSFLEAQRMSGWQNERGER